jgi:ribosomal-protein-alanine N-acetyltransferase
LYSRQLEFIFNLTFSAVKRSTPRYLLCAVHGRSSLQIPTKCGKTNSQVESMSGDIKDHGRSIRSATEEDFDRVLEIDRHSFSAPWIYNFFKSALNNIFLVLEKEREIAGYLIACVCHDLEKAVILRIAVHPDQRGKGIAKELLRRCLEILTERKIRIVELDVELIQREAIKLYEKFGFKIANIIVFPSDTLGEEETFYIMRLELAESEVAVSSKR